MPDCVPPQSLATWSDVLLYGALALGVEALALLFTLRPIKGGSWRWLALRGLLFAGVVTVAVWSLTISASAQAMYQGYVTLFDWNSDACLYAYDLQGPLSSQDAFQRLMQAAAAPIEHTAAIASGISAVLLLVGGYLLARWIRQRRRPLPQSMPGMESDEWRRERMV